MNLIIILFSSSIFLLCFSPVFSKATDILTPSDTLSINQTLISSGGKFELGFFTLGKPTKYYLGIWYKDIPSTDVKVWVANRDSPSMTNSTTLKLQNDAKLVIFYDGSNGIWSSSNQPKAVNPVLQLLDSGNLVVRVSGDHNPDHYIWQSFDSPTDTLLPGQKLGWNLETGLNLYINSWRGPDDPGRGDYSFKMDYKGEPPDICLWKDDMKIIYRTGPWVGQRFSGVPEMKSGNSGFKFTFYTGQDEVYYSFELPKNDTVKSRLMVSSDGSIGRWDWIPDVSKWVLYWFARMDQCDDYRICGSYSICNVSALFYCQCPPRFEPKDPVAWSLRDGSSGCFRKTKLDCGSDGFIRLENMKLPETSTSFVDKSMSLEECQEMCKRNCSCTAYANAQLVQKIGSGCVIWTDDLTDMRGYVEGGQDLYLRVATSNVESNQGGNNSKVKTIVAITGSLGAALVLIFLFLLRRCKIQKQGKKLHRKKTASHAFEIDERQNKLDEVPLFEFKKLALATNNFHASNKLGRGGFGPVYRGQLENGQEIAVKRLSSISGQGQEEFMNEVSVISKLQHRNLVRLLGCCAEEKEQILVYEYMPNKSLDSFLFDLQKRELLPWKKRYDIILGICWGLLYLHRDSRLRIIHRDLKASNILLNEDLNPKISDFGMARIFQGNQDQDDTRRVVGTYGYMSPEYAMEGRFSEKSDVFSFGVLLLEIVSGKRNSLFSYKEQSLSLLGYAYKLWTEGNTFPLIDPATVEPFFQEEIEKCIHVGLLCVQEFNKDRPSISTVISMLISETTNLPRPKEPGFFHRQFPMQDGLSSQQRHQSNVNDVSVTALYAR